MKTLFLDLETSPNLAYVWSLWDSRIGINQLVSTTEVICFGARWGNSKKVIFKSVHHDGKKAMLDEMHRLLDEADVVVGWNSATFDTKHMMREFVENGYLPPSPYKDLDLMRVVKSRFRFPSNKLDYVAQRLGLGKKNHHEGHTLWIKCMNNDKAAWKVMEQYNIQDVVLLEKLYKKLLPWIKQPINLSLMKKDRNGFVCPTCSKSSLMSKGFRYTTTGAYQRYICKACGAYATDTRSVIPHSKLKHLA